MHLSKYIYYEREGVWRRTCNLRSKFFALLSRSIMSITSQVRSCVYGNKYKYLGEWEVLRGQSH
jgi:hypothetical protein